jgi:cutinase
MKFSLLPLLAVSVAAAPSITTDLMTRQVSGLNFNAKELKAGSFQCKYAALIFARGTGEPGNLGSVVGPGLATKLKAAMNGDLLVQGADYTTNFSGGGATEMVKLARQVIEKCPGKTRLIFGGYSQGAMQVHQAIEKLGADAKNVRVSSHSALWFSSAIHV